MAQTDFFFGVSFESIKEVIDEEVAKNKYSGRWGGRQTEQQRRKGAKKGRTKAQRRAVPYIDGPTKHRRKRYVTEARGWGGWRSIKVQIIVILCRRRSCCCRAARCHQHYFNMIFRVELERFSGNVEGNGNAIYNMKLIQLMNSHCNPVQAKVW